MRLTWLAVPLLGMISCRGQDGAPARPQVAGPAPVASTPSPGWSAQVARNLAEEQRQPQQVQGGFALSGGALHMRLDPSGIEVGGWRFELEGDLAEPEVDGSRVTYRRGAGVTEWYEARPEGIEQGFTIDELPADGGDLIVQGRVDSGEPGRVVDGGVLFGELRYAGLAASPMRPTTVAWSPTRRRPTPT